MKYPARYYCFDMWIQRTIRMIEERIAYDLKRGAPIDFVKALKALKLFRDALR